MAAIVLPLVLWRFWLGDTKGVRPVKTLHQNPLAMVVDISGWVHTIVHCGVPTCQSMQFFMFFSDGNGDRCADQRDTCWTRSHCWGSWVTNWEADEPTCRRRPSFTFETKFVRLLLGFKLLVIAGDILSWWQADCWSGVPGILEMWGNLTAVRVVLPKSDQSRYSAYIKPRKTIRTIKTGKQ